MIKLAITRGLGRGGRMAEPMPCAWYADIRQEDLEAVVAYLRTLSAVR